MAYSQTVTDRISIGNKKMVYGTYNCAAVTTGEVVTGLKVVEQMSLQPKGAAVLATQSVINESFPLGNRSAVTIITTSGEVGTWWAIGY